MAENKEKREAKSGPTTRNADRTAATSRRAPSALAARDPFATALGLTSPFSFMRRFTEDMDRLFGDFGLGRTSDIAPGGSIAGTMWAPQIELFERDNRLMVRAELPGMKREDINVELTDDSLVLSGEREHERKEEREGFYRSEFSYGSFNRRIPLPEGTNVDTAKASFQNGVLEITMETAPRPTARSRRLEIEQREQPQSQKVG